jgi:hypothetical protein
MDNWKKPLQLHETPRPVLHETPKPVLHESPKLYEDRPPRQRDMTKRCTGLYRSPRRYHDQE